MAIDAVSPVMSTSPLTTISRPPETTPDAREAAEQENDARQVAQSVSGASPASLGRPEEAAGPVSPGTRMPVVATPDTEAALQQSSAEIVRASNEPDSNAALRTASEAYQSQATAREDLARQQQGNGATRIDVLA